jgi:hypothetical protein
MGDEGTTSSSTSAANPLPAPLTDLWQAPAPIPARPGNPPTALAIVLLCSACGLYAVVSFVLHWRRSQAARKAEEAAHSRQRAAAITQMHQRGGPTQCSPTRSGSTYHAGVLKKSERRTRTLDATDIIRLDGESPSRGTPRPAPRPRVVDLGRPRELAFLSSSDEDDEHHHDVGRDEFHAYLQPSSTISAVTI